MHAIKEIFFLTWPGLTYSLIQKHLVVPQSTLLGHIKQEKHSLRSTKPQLTQNKTYTESNDMFYSIIQNKNKAFMDLTGRIPYKSSRGNEYILIAYHVDSNAIIGTPVKNRQANTFKKASLHSHNQFSQSTSTPNTWILDNEISGDLQFTMIKNKVQFQLVPPHNHRANLAERAIQTFKNHLKAR